MTDDIQIDTGPIGQLQDEMAEALRSDPYFADIPVLTEKMKEITYELDRALGTLAGQGGSVGIFAVIATPRLRVTHTNQPGPVFDDDIVIVRVVEDPLSNQEDGGTKKRCADVAKKVAERLHHQANPQLYDPLLCLELGSVPEENYPSCVVYDVRFKTGLKA